MVSPIPPNTALSSLESEIPSSTDEFDKCLTASELKVRTTRSRRKSLRLRKRIRLHRHLRLNKVYLSQLRTHPHLTAPFTENAPSAWLSFRKPTTTSPQNAVDAIQATFTVHQPVPVDPLKADSSFQLLLLKRNQRRLFTIRLLRLSWPQLQSIDLRRRYPNH